MFDDPNLVVVTPPATELAVDTFLPPAEAQELAFPDALGVAAAQPLADNLYIPTRTRALDNYGGLGYASVEASPREVRCWGNQHYFTCRHEAVCECGACSRVPPVKFEMTSGL